MTKLWAPTIVRSASQSTYSMKHATPPEDTIAKLQKRIVAFNEARNWTQFHSPKDLALSLVLEASEVLEHFQWKTDDEMLEYLKIHKGDVADELCDTLYWVLLMAHYFDINLEQHFEHKMQKNEHKYPVEKAHDSHKKYTELG